MIISPNQNGLFFVLKIQTLRISIRRDEHSEISPNSVLNAKFPKTELRFIALIHIERNRDDVK